MSRDLLARNLLVDWQIAPAQFETANYDWPKIQYRQHVENMIASVPKKSLKKKTFVTISTNVLCAEIASSKDTIDPIDRDIYLPLEIALTKWSVSDAGKLAEDRTLQTHYWLLKPGDPPRLCRNYALDHMRKHKIEFDKLDPTQDTFIETDLQKVIKEINNVLTPDRTVFSLTLEHCRQDLGCLKWLNRETNYKTKPIKVFNLEDLYVVLIRTLAEDTQIKESVCQGLAKHRMECTSYIYEISKHCRYHKEKASEDDGDDCDCCAKARALGYTTVLLDDLKLYTDIFESRDVKPTSTKKHIGQLLFQNQ